MRLLIALVTIVILALICGPSQLVRAMSNSQKTAEEINAPAFQISSSAFEADSAIPSKYSCSGGNVSPALAWTEPPAGTQSFALIVDDPDASAATPAVHWLVYAIPASTRSLPEGVGAKSTLPDKSRQGKNSAGKVGYRGPCPDPGKVHHYFFKLFALDYLPKLKAKSDIAGVESAIKDHTLGTAELIGRFQRE